MASLLQHEVFWALLTPEEDSYMAGGRGKEGWQHVCGCRACFGVEKGFLCVCSCCDMGVVVSARTEHVTNPKLDPSLLL